MLNPLDASAFAQFAQMLDNAPTPQYTAEDCQKALDEAKLHMLTKQHNAFLSSLLYNFEVTPDDQNTKTIHHNLTESKIGVNSNWFCNLEPNLRATAIAEQLYHIAFMHEWRQGQKDPQLYQKACDQVVRNMLTTAGFELLHNAPVDTKYKNLSVENVYTEMEKEWNKGNDKNQNNGSGGGNNNDPLGNDVNPDNSSGDQPSPQAQQRLQQALNNAAMAEEMTSGKQMAKEGQEFEHLFENINKGKLAWNVILQNYLNERTQGEITYERFDRRMLPYDLYLPTNISQANINKVAVAFDVSGSVTEEQIRAFLREMHTIKDQLNPKKMDVVTFNHHIVDIFTFTEYDQINNVTMDIDGGTDLEPVFNHYLEPANKPEFLIVFSDLECDPIQDKTPFDTIWICIDNPEAEVNFGKLIHITTEELTNV